MNEDNGNTNGLPMDDERRQRTMEFILEHQAKFHSDIEQLTINVSELTNDIKQIWRILRMGLVAGRRVRSEFRRSQAEIKELREMGYEQDKRITAIIDTNHELQEIARRNLENIDRLSKTSEQNSENIDRLSKTVEQNSENIDRLSKTVEQSSENIDRLSKTVEQNSESAKRNLEAIERVSETTNRNAEAIGELQKLARQNETRWTEVKEAMLEMSKSVKSAHERIDVVEEKIEKKKSD